MVSRGVDNCRTDSNFRTSDVIVDQDINKTRNNKNILIKYMSYVKFHCF